MYALPNFKNESFPMLEKHILLEVKDI